MADCCENAEKRSTRVRPWYRPHLLTWLVVMLLAMILVLMIAPGELRALYDGNSNVADWREPLPSTEYFVYGQYYFEHGWPLTYLHRLASPAPSKRTPWLGRESWTFGGLGRGFSLGNLLIDILVALLIIFLVGASFEWWMRCRRNVWQFSLRELLALVVVVAVPLAWWRTHHHRYQQEIHALNETYIVGDNYDATYVKDLGDNQSPYHSFETAYCGPKWLRKLVPVQRLRVYKTIVQLRLRLYFRGTHYDVELAHLAHLPYLQELSLYTTQVNDQEFQCITDLTSLRSLSLRRTKITDAGLVHLRGLANLERLDLKEMQVTHQGVEQLRQWLPNCEITYDRDRTTRE